jgi:hypothetical protein
LQEKEVELQSVFTSALDGVESYNTFIKLQLGCHPVAVVQYTFTNRKTQNKQYTEQHKEFGRVWAVPRLGELYPGICLTTEEKARKNLS